MDARKSGQAPGHGEKDTMKTEVTFQTEGGSFSGTVDERGVFHEALEHLLPDHLRVGRRITIRTPGGDPVYPDMFVGETVAHFRTTTFTVRSEPLRGQQGAWRNLGVDHSALAVAGMGYGSKTTRCLAPASPDLTLRLEAAPFRRGRGHWWPARPGSLRGRGGPACR